MPIMDARSLRAFCRPPMGVPVSFGEVSTYADDGSTICGLLDRSLQYGGMEQGIGGVDIDGLELRLPFNAFSPMPANDDAIIVDGTEYTVYPPTAEDDGAFLCYRLKAAE